jgi:cell shape-determining protein MreC
MSIAPTEESIAQAERWESAIFKGLQRRIDQLEAENARLRELLGMAPKQSREGDPV